MPSLFEQNNFKTNVTMAWRSIQNRNDLKVGRFVRYCYLTPENKKECLKEFKIQDVGNHYAVLFDVSEGLSRDNSEEFPGILIMPIFVLLNGSHEVSE